MRLVIEPWVPFEHSVIWRLHDAYFAQRGPAAWTLNEVPSYSTSNLASARRHARLFAALVDDLEAAGTVAPGAPLWVLEPGCGSGLFAAHFMHAIDTDPDLVPLAPRVRYVIADYSEKNLREVLETPRVAPLAAAGRLLAARFDARRPDHIELLDGPPLTEPIAFVVTNYVCCVLPMHHLQKHEDDRWYALWGECHAEVDPPGQPGFARPSGELPDGDPTDESAARAYVDAMLADATGTHIQRELEVAFQWRPLEVDLTTHLGADRVSPGQPGFTRPSGELHARILQRATAGMPLATVGYPTPYFDFMLGIRPRLLPGAAILTNDYGSPSASTLRGHYERRPQRYGNSLAQDVNTSLFDAFAAETGWSVLRSTGLLDSLHAALALPSPPGPAVRARFADEYGRRPATEDLLDFTAAARVFAQRKEGTRALRYLMRAAELDGRNASLRYQVGEAALSENLPELALEHLMEGLELDPEAGDWEFMIGRALSTLSRLDEARTWYERSLQREDHPVTWTNLGTLHAHQGRLAEAWRCYDRAMAIDPKYERARERMEQLKSKLWDETVARWRAGAV
ncbi:MAG: tetratricopeptide repeat protein [Deltaproteobacteria bacterium]|nr:tetratricopeptide repeat protein [Deltaproteobacteria bacterium]